MGGYKTVWALALTVGVMLLGTGCSGRKEVALAAKDETIVSQQAQLAKAEADKQQMADMNARLAQQNDQMAQQNAVMAAKNANETAQLRKEVEDLASIMNGIDKKMTVVKPGQGVPDGEASAYSVHPDGSIHITVASTVCFDSGKADLKDSSHTMLKNVAKTIKARFPSNFIRVEGHTDRTPVVHNKGKYPDNMALSISRSRAVYDFMIKEGGIAASKMYTAGYGEHQPLVNPEKTVADRSKNRRVEIVIMPTNVIVKKDQLADAKPAAASSVIHKK